MFEGQTYDVILNRMLARAPEGVDTRESSFLYNANAPVALELASAYVALGNIYKLTFFSTADRAGKIARCEEAGIDTTQFDATYAVCVLSVTPAAAEISVGDRFNLGAINYAVTGSTGTDGEYYCKCETAGTAGNQTGSVTPITYISGLASAEITSVYDMAEDEADTDTIDSVYYAHIQRSAFGGNKEDYFEKVKALDGVGGVKVYPVWNGGGTVKVVFQAADYGVPDAGTVSAVQTAVDPLQNQGDGLGTAPVGHTVTVAGCTGTTVNISATFTLKDGYEWADVSDSVNAAIDTYFSTINAAWEDQSAIIVRISYIETAILAIEGIVDIENTALNGTKANLLLDADAVAVRGTVTNG